MKNEMNSARKQGLYALVMFFSLLATGAFAQDAEIKAANKQLNAEQTKKALEALTKATQTYPESPKVWYALGMAQAKTGDKKNAEISFQKGIEKDPKDGLNLAGKAYLRMLDNNVAEAKQLIDQALALTKSKSAPVLTAIAEAYLTNDKFTNDALTLLLKAKSISDSDPNTAILLGDAYVKLAKGGEAVDSYERAARIDPTNGLPAYKTALVFFRSHNNEVAIENLIKATKADPNFAPAYNQLGETYYVAKQADNAVQAQETYLKITETPEKGQFKMAFYYFMAKKYAEAVGIFKKLAAEPNVTAQVLKYYAYALTKSGNLAEAKTTFDRYFSISKEITGSDYEYYADLLLQLKLDTLAATNYVKAYRVDSTLTDDLKKGADLFFKLKKYDSAAVSYKTMLKNKKETAVYFNLGKSYYLIKDYINADSSFLKVIELAPNMTVGYLWEGRTKAALDPDMKDEAKVVEAKKYFDLLIEKALTATPDKAKNDLIEGYMYNAAYYIQLKSDLKTAESYLNKVLALDPNHAKAKEAIQAIKDAYKAQQAQQKPKQK